MSKSKKRTISALLKGRQGGKFSSGGFDLLGEGDRIVAAIDDKAVQPKMATPPPSFEELSAYADALYKATASLEKNTTADSAIVDPAMEAIARRLYSGNFTETKSSMAGKAIVSEAIAGDVTARSIVSKIIANPAIESSAMADFTIVKDAIVNYAGEWGVVSDAIGVSAVEQNAIELDSIEKSAIVDGALEGIAIEGYAIESNPIAPVAVGGDAIAEGGIGEDAIEGFAIAEKEGMGVDRVSAQKGLLKKADIKPTKLPSSKTLKGIGTRQAYQESHEELERLKANSGTTTIVDNYVFDTLFKEINNASESMIYLYLWRRTYGSGKKNVELSYQVLADAIGVSKRGGQEVLKRLHEKKLIKIDLEGKTGIPSYEVLCPWQKK